MPDSSTAIVPWQSLTPKVIPPSVGEPSLMVKDYAVALKEPEKRALITAFKNNEYSMGAGYLWRRAMAKLRSRLAQLGIRFLGEMLNREDINELSSPESVLTDTNTITLAESLGYVDATGALRLRQGFETLAHFDQDRASEEMSITEAAGIVRACVQYIVGSNDNDAALDFSNFRDKLTSETLKEGNPSVNQLIESPPFFLRTALRVLIAAVKTEQSAKLEYALANLNLILPDIWARLSDEDRWSLGNTYLEVTGAGNNPIAVAGIRKALLRVKGFDYVPENLRSNSFRQAAAAVLAAHNGFNNFSLEEAPMRILAAMGNIPQPALTECLRAYLCVYLGNTWGHSWYAAPLAESELRKLSADRWQYFLSRVLPTENDILYKLMELKPVTRWLALRLESIVPLDQIPNPLVKKIIEASRHGNAPEIQALALRLLNAFKGK